MSASHENNVRVFTDDDLKRLKESYNNGPHNTGGMTVVLTPELQALLARLEAAEWALLRFHSISEDIRTEGMREALKVWREAAGKK